MTIEMLGELFAMMDISYEEYIAHPQYAFLVQNPENIEKAERFMLPEVIRLICYSDQLLGTPWGQRYKHVAPLYRAPFTPEVVLKLFDTPAQFEQQICLVADYIVRKPFLDFFASLDQERKKLSSEKSAATKKVNQLAAEIEQNGSSPELADQLKAFEEQKAELNARADAVDKEKRRWKAYRALLSETNNYWDDEEVNARREEVYEFFAEDSSCDTTTVEPAEEENNDVSISFIMERYAQGELDLEDEGTKCYLRSHPDDVARYLYERLAAMKDQAGAEDDHILLEVILSMELQSIAQNDAPILPVLWESIEDYDLWAVVYDSLLHMSDNPEPSVGAFLSICPENAYPEIIRWIETREAEQGTLSLAQLVTYLVNNKLAPAFVLQVQENSERTIRTLQRKVRVLEKKSAGNAQQLFSAVYTPTEKLEELTASLLYSTGDISCELVAHQLTGIVKMLRQGFESLGLATLTNEEDWANKKQVAFDPEHHQVMLDSDHSPEKVHLQTLGFSYQNDQGEQCIYPAHVAKKEKKQPRTYPNKKKTISGAQPNTPKQAQAKKQRDRAPNKSQKKREN